MVSKTSTFNPKQEYLTPQVIKRRGERTCPAPCRDHIARIVTNPTFIQKNPKKMAVIASPSVLDVWRDLEGQLTEITDLTSPNQINEV